MRIARTFGLATLLGVAWACSARADFDDYSFFATPPSYTPASDQSESFTLILKGNVLGQLNLSAVSADPTLNPFLYVNNNYFGGSGTTSVTGSVDGNGNTDVVFTGSNAILPSYTFSYGSSSDNLPNFGLSTTGSPAPTLTTLSSSWNVVPDVGSPMVVNQPGLSITPPQPGGSLAGYLVVYAEVTSGSQSSGQWFELPYTGTSPMLTNYTNAPETLSNVGYFLSPTLIPLDNLNYGTEPPPGLPGSPFTPDPGADGMTLTPGNGMGGAGGSLSLVPEPSSILSLALGLSLTAGYLRRRAGRKG